MGVILAVLRPRCDAGAVSTPAVVPQPPAWLVPVQFLAAAAHLLPGGPAVAVPRPVRLLGGLAVAVGVGLTWSSARVLGADLTSSVTPRPDAVLRTGGTYARSRHPLYAGLLVASAGVVLLRGRLSTLVAATVLAGVLHVKAGAEDQVLAERFGPAWQDYAARVPRLLPGLPGR